MAEENKKVEAVEELVDLKVTVDNHRHNGKPALKGKTIKVAPEVKVMLEKAWAEQKKAGA